MQTKLTLRLEDSLVKQAKEYAKAHGKSVSQIVADYFTALTVQAESHDEAVAPVTRSLRGMLKGKGIEEGDYERYLEDKYL